ncbi:MAG: hypothetical protein ABIA21_03545 [Candidatus Aenigmatarchaeota archaeon]
MPPFRRIPFFYCSNENLNAMTEGLSVNSDDRVLAIGGSGDQAFALLEYAESVNIADTNLRQLDYIRKRITHLENGDYESFLKLDDPNVEIGLKDEEMTRLVKENRRNYFRKEGRLDIVREKVDKITIHEPDNILRIALNTPDTVSKLYCSDISLISFVDLPTKSLKKDFKRVVFVGGLIYFANDKTAFGTRLINDFGFEDIIKEKKLTGLANHYEIKNGGFWKPAVYKRVS